ncbi:MAG: hypothetical protein K5886_00930 [Lachnospiraceae bacterium]|nr:hypothetical protein [Lachnospiraceae bacterium]
MKKIIAFFIFTTIMTTLIGCSVSSNTGSKSTPTESSTKVERIAETLIEDNNPKDIKVETTEKDSVSYPESENSKEDRSETAEITTAHNKPEQDVSKNEAIELPSQEDYWDLNYFDLTQYLLDCGAKEVTTSTEDLGPIPSIIIADFGDFYLEISTCNYEHVANIFIGTNLPDTYGFYRSFDYNNDNLTTTYIIIDLNDGTMVHQASIEALPDIIKGIKSFTQKTPGERPIIENCIYPE